jgi:hypothetical protein
MAESNPSIFVPPLKAYRPLENIKNLHCDDFRCQFTLPETGPEIIRISKSDMPMSYGILGDYLKQINPSAPKDFVTFGTKTYNKKCISLIKCDGSECTVFNGKSGEKFVMKENVDKIKSFIAKESE